MTRLIGSRQRLDRLGCAGNAAVEFALMIPVLLLLIIGIYEFGRAYWIQNTVQYAAEQTGRCVMGKTTNSDGTTPVTISGPSATCPYSNNLGGLSTASVTVDTNALVSPCVTSVIAPTSHCQLIKLKYTFTFNGLLAGLMGLVVHGSASMPNVTFVGQSQVPIG
jgi:Flp pilus assembly protein TadG